LPILFFANILYKKKFTINFVRNTYEFFNFAKKKYFFNKFVRKISCNIEIFNNASVKFERNRWTFF